MSLRVETKQIKDLKPSIYNPRKRLKPTDASYQKIARSIEDFGYVDPIIWNEKTGRVVSGHQRLQILKDKGIMEVDVSVVSLDEPEEMALNLAMNKIRSQFNFVALQDVLITLDAANVDLEATSFSMAEIEAMMTRPGSMSRPQEPPSDKTIEVICPECGETFMMKASELKKKE